MKVYITPAGKTALLITDFLARPKQEFGYDLAIMLTDNQYINNLYEKHANENLLIVPISNPYFGLVDYMPTVRRLVKQTLVFGANPELIIINSSGGTEKMTNIVKDAGDILALQYPTKRVFGVYDKHSKDVIFTEKPQMDIREEFDSISQEAELILNLKESLHVPESMDVDKGQGGPGFGE